MVLGLCLFAAFGVVDAHAARIGDLSETRIWEQAIRFFSLRDPAVRYAALGAILLGTSCGLLGSFIVVRKMALVGDTLSHAVLPGVAVGFLWNMSKDPIAIFIGAVAAGLLGVLFVNWIQQTTRLKEDTALGLALAGFFAVGICLVTMMQRLPTGSKSGIDKFLFGQAAALGAADVKLMAVVTLLSVATIFLFYKEFLVASFDPGFAKASGHSVKVAHYTLMWLLAFSIVISLQAVGVVLVSAMLITPAAAAYLLTDRMHRMVLYSMAFGIASGLVGAFISFLRPNLPTGPFMVLAASLIFAVAFVAAPRHGIVVRWWRQRSQSRRVQRENTLKSIYHVLEGRSFQQEGVTVEELAARRRETVEEIRQQAADLRAHELATFDKHDGVIYLTPEGWQRAAAIVRNHRLWELYLTNAAQIAPDHVHEDAEKIEHVLGEEVVRQLERKLAFAKEDPHGRLIPDVATIQRGSGPRREAPSGYRRSE